MRCSLLAFALSALLVGTSSCRSGDGQKAWLELCSGFAAPAGGFLIGRAHRGTPPLEPKPGESSWQRLQETLDSLEADPLRDAEVAIRLGDRPFAEVRSNDRGYIDLSSFPSLLPPSVRVHVELKDARYRATPLDAEIPVYGDEPGLGIITDIDDTLLDTGVTDKARMLKDAATRSTWELRDFPQAARVLSMHGQGRPVFYVSGSPWGFRQRIGGFLSRQGFPKGPLLLKRFSSDPALDQESYKWQHLSRIVDALPGRRWWLYGDSGEKDPEIYARLRAQRPGRVEAIYIHLVTQEDPASPRFSFMRVFRDWQELLEKPPAPAKP